MRRRRDSGVRRFLSAILALWITVFSVAIHGLHTCTLHQPGQCQCHSDVFPPGNSPFHRAYCICQLLQRPQVTTDHGTRASHIIALHNCGGDCLACRYLAQPQMPSSVPILLMAVEHVSDATACAPIAPFPASPAYSPDCPRAPPITLA